MNRAIQAIDDDEIQLALDDFTTAYQSISNDPLRAFINLTFIARCYHLLEDWSNLKQTYKEVRAVAANLNHPGNEIDQVLHLIGCWDETHRLTADNIKIRSTLPDDGIEIQGFPVISPGERNLFVGRLMIGEFGVLDADERSETALSALILARDNGSPRFSGFAEITIRDEKWDVGPHLEHLKDLATNEKHPLIVRNDALTAWLHAEYGENPERALNLFEKHHARVDKSSRPHLRIHFYNDHLHHLLEAALSTLSDTDSVNLRQMMSEQLNRILVKTADDFNSLPVDSEHQYLIVTMMDCAIELDSEEQIESIRPLLEQLDIDTCQDAMKFEILCLHSELAAREYDYEKVRHYQSGLSRIQSRSEWTPNETEQNLKRIKRLTKRIGRRRKAGIRVGVNVEILQGQFRGCRAHVTGVSENKDEVTVELVDVPVPIPITIRSDWVRVTTEESLPSQLFLKRWKYLKYSSNLPLFKLAIKKKDRHYFTYFKDSKNREYYSPVDVVLDSDKIAEDEVKSEEGQTKLVPGLHLVRTWDEFERALRDENLHVPENRPGSAGKLADLAAHLRRLLKTTATQIVGIKAPSRSGKTSLIGSLLAEQQGESVCLFVTKGEMIAKSPQTGYRYTISIGHKVADVEKWTFEEIRAGVKEIFEEHDIPSQRLQRGGEADSAGWGDEPTTVIVATLLDEPREDSIRNAKIALEQRFEQDEVWIEKDIVEMIREAPGIAAAVLKAVADVDDDINVLLVEDLGKKSGLEEVDALFSLIEQLNIPVIVTFADESISAAIEQKRLESGISESAIHTIGVVWDRESAEAAIDSMLEEADEGVELESEAREYLISQMSREEPELRMSVGIVGSQLNSALPGAITISDVGGWENSPLHRLVATVVELNGKRRNPPMALRRLLAIHKSLEEAVLPSGLIQDYLSDAGLDIDDASTRYGLVPHQHFPGVEYSYYAQTDDEWGHACNPERLSRLSGEGSKISGLDETMRILRKMQNDLDKESNEFSEYLTELNRDTLESKKPCQDAAVWFEAVTAIEPPELLSIEVALDGVDDEWIRLAHTMLREKLRADVPDEWWGEPQFKSYMERRIQLSQHRKEKNPKDIFAVDGYASDLWQLATQYEFRSVDPNDVDFEMNALKRDELFEAAYDTWLSIEPNSENAKSFNDLFLLAGMDQAILTIESGVGEKNRDEIDRHIGHIEFMESWMSYLPYNSSIQWRIASSIGHVVADELRLYFDEGVDDERVERLSSMIERNIESFQRIADSPDGFSEAEQITERDDEGVAQDIMRVQMHLASMKRGLLELRLAVQGPAEAEDDILGEIVEHLESLGQGFELFDSRRSNLSSLYVWYNTLRMSEPTENQRQLWSEVAEQGMPSHSVARVRGVTHELGLAYQLSIILTGQHPEMARFALLTLLKLCRIVAPEARPEDVDSMIAEMRTDDHPTSLLALLGSSFHTSSLIKPTQVGAKLLELLGVIDSEEE